MNIWLVLKPLSQQVIALWDIPEAFSNVLLRGQSKGWEPIGEGDYVMDRCHSSNAARRIRVEERKRQALLLHWSKGEIEL